MSRDVAFMPGSGVAVMSANTANLLPLIDQPLVYTPANVSESGGVVITGQPPQVGTLPTGATPVSATIVLAGGPAGADESLTITIGLNVFEVALELNDTVAIALAKVITALFDGESAASVNILRAGYVYAESDADSVAIVYTPGTLVAEAAGITVDDSDSTITATTEDDFAGGSGVIALESFPFSYTANPSSGTPAFSMAFQGGMRYDGADLTLVRALVNGGASVK